MFTIRDLWLVVEILFRFPETTQCLLCPLPVSSKVMGTCHTRILTDKNKSPCAGHLMLPFIFIPTPLALSQPAATNMSSISITWRMFHTGMM